MKRAISSGVLAVLLLTGTAVSMERFDIVTTSEMAQMLADREGGRADFILVNTLDEIISMHSSIPGSVNLPWSRIDAFKDRLGTDKDRLIITYCMGYR